MASADEQGGGGLARLAWTRAAAAAYELWMLLPLGLLVLHFSFVQVSAFGPWPAIAAAGSVAAGMAGLRFRTAWKQGAVSLAAAALVCGVCSALGRPDAAAGSAALFVAALQGFTAASRMRRPAWYWTGVGLYFAVSALFRIVQGWNGYADLLTGGGIVCLAVALFATNGLHLRAVTLAPDRSARVPAELARHNRLFVGAMLAGMLLLGAGLGGMLIGLLQHSIGSLVRAVLAWLKRGGEPQLPSPAASQPPPPPPALPPAAEPGWFVHALDVLLRIGAVLALAAAAGWGMYRLYRHAPGFWRKWRERLAALLFRSRSEPETPGFTDEQASLFSWEETLGKLRGSRIARLLAGRQEPGWNELPTGRDRARYLYRRWLRAMIRRGYETKAYLTPRETEQDAMQWLAQRREAAATPHALIDLYDKARYGEEDPTEEELEAAKKAVETHHSSPHQS